MFLSDDDLERDLMARRQFVDAGGVEWTVYDIVTETGPGKKRLAGPRKTTWAAAWLVFESAAERRRFSPLPLAWDELADEELQRLLSHATPTSKVLKRRE